MEIRELKAKDVKTLAQMLGKLDQKSINGILSNLDKTANQLEVGVSIFRMIAADLTDDIYFWLADLIGKKPEELDEMSFDTPVDIIKALIARGDFADFFGQATRLAEKGKKDSMTSFNPDTTGQTGN